MKATRAAQTCGLALGLALLFWQGAAATIYNWQTGQPIPGTEGITPGPGQNFGNWNTPSHNLQYGDFRSTDLNHSRFVSSWLDYAHFGGANLTWANLNLAKLSGANLSGANLTSAYLRSAALTGANLADATVRGANFQDTSSRGFTEDQLYSTASWKAKDLTEIWLGRNDLSGWNLAGQNLTSADLSSATLTGANLSGANLTSVDLYETTLTSANLADAIIRSADLSYTTSRGFTKEQLYSTASWKAKDLTHIWLRRNDLSGWNLAGQNLTSADLYQATLSGADLSGANLTSAYLSSATLTGANVADAIVQGATLYYITKEQLYSTASWKAKDLTHIWLGYKDLSGWNLAGQNLTSADLGYGTLTGADLSGANLTSANLSSATLTGANLADAIVRSATLYYTTSSGFTKEQLYSTASWKAKDLTGIRLGPNDLSGWNLAGQNLTSANLSSATLTGADLTDAIIQHADFGITTCSGFTKEQLYSTASWKAKDLRGIGLSANNLSGWNLAGQNLTSADLSDATLTGADLADAIVQMAKFRSTTSRGFTKEQLYSTASWKAKDLTWISLRSNDLSGWNLAGQNLSFAFLGRSNLSGANLTSAYLVHTDLTLADLRKAQGADLTWAVTRNTILPDGTVAGLNLLAGDTLVIRNCDLAVTVQSAMTLDGASVLKLLLEGGWGSTVAAPSGAVPDLGGALQLGFADGVDPALLVGKTFDLFNWAGPLDTGNRFDDVRFEPWASWDLGALYATGEVTLLAVPEPAALSLLALGMLCIASARRRCRPLA